MAISKNLQVQVVYRNFRNSAKIGVDWKIDVDHFCENVQEKNASDVDNNKRWYGARQTFEILANMKKRTSRRFKLHITKDRELTRNFKSLSSQNIPMHLYAYMQNYMRIIKLKLYVCPVRHQQKNQHTKFSVNANNKIQKRPLYYCKVIISFVG